MALNLDMRLVVEQPPSMSRMLDDSPRCDLPDYRDRCAHCDEASIVIVLAQAGISATICLICDGLSAS